MKKLILTITIIMIFIYALPTSACALNTKADETTGPETETGAANPVGNGQDITEPEEPPTSADAFDFTEQDGQIVITGLSGDGLTEVIIPSEIDGKPVRKIEKNAFKSRKNLRRLYVPTSVNSIGYGILSECAALSSLSLPFTGETHRTEKGLKDYPFGYIFGETPYSGGTATMQFYHDTSSESVEMAHYYIPETLKTVEIRGIDGTHLPYGAFYNCSALDKITIGGKITSVGAFAFSGTTAEIVWKNPSIKTIGEHAFEDFKGETLTIPDTVISIEKKGYADCVNVKEFVVPDSVKYIDVYAFSYCYELESATIGKNVSALPVETFYFCTKLKTVVLPEGLTLIEDGAFDGCKALTRIEIPASVSRINANAFKNCSALKNADFKDANGWRYYGLDSSGDYFDAATLSDGTTAAKYLTDNFKDYIWEKTPR